MTGVPAPVSWEGDSLTVIRSFSDAAKEHLGGDLRRLQNGKNPLDWGPMGAALPGVFELRDEDKDFWYRLLYKRMGGVIYVLHCFRKKTAQTPQKDIHTARLRLQNVVRRLAEARRREKHGQT